MSNVTQLFRDQRPKCKCGWIAPKKIELKVFGDHNNLEVDCTILCPICQCECVDYKAELLPNVDELEDDVS